MSKHQPASRSAKRRQFEQYRRGNRRAGLLIGGAFALLALTIYFGVTRTPAAGTPDVGPVAELTPGQDARLAVSSFADGRARFYRYTTSISREVRLFVMRSSDGVVRAAFDACDVCYRARKGYYQSGDTMVCVNCGQTFHSRNINEMSGGCNPAPIQRTIEGGEVVLKAADLDLGAVYF